MRLLATILIFTAFLLQASHPGIHEATIKQHASIVDLHERQYLHATQALSQAQIKYDADNYPLEKSLFNLGSKKGNIWTNSKSLSQERTLFNQLPHVLDKMNTGIVAHANALKLSVLDLPRFYQLASHSDFAFLFNLSHQHNVPQKNSNPATVEVLCKLTADLCRSELKHSSVKMVARIWDKATKQNISNRQEFEVQYLDSDTQALISQEVWVFYDKIGPRYLRNMK